jgi:hypothetical protein
MGETVTITEDLHITSDLYTDSIKSNNLSGPSIITIDSNKVIITGDLQVNDNVSVGNTLYTSIIEPIDGSTVVNIKGITVAEDLIIHNDLYTDSIKSNNLSGPSIITIDSNNIITTGDLQVNDNMSVGNTLYTSIIEPIDGSTNVNIMGITVAEDLIVHNDLYTDSIKSNNLSGPSIITIDSDDVVINNDLHINKILTSGLNMISSNSIMILNNNSFINDIFDIKFDVNTLKRIYIIKDVINTNSTFTIILPLNITAETSGFLITIKNLRSDNIIINSIESINFQLGMNNSCTIMSLYTDSGSEWILL